MKPLISVITPSFNQAKYIEQNIKSVINQNYDNFEHIIIDRLSSDGTIDILKKYNHLYWISEIDSGQSDALTKGLKIAKGEIVIWLNADDFLCPNVFGDIVEIYLQNPNKWYIGNMILIEDFSNKLYFIKTPKINYKIYFNPYIVRQPAAIYSREILIKAGGFNKYYHMVMDFDLWIRLYKICKPIQFDTYIAYFRIHPDQKSQFKNLKIQTAELIDVIIKHKLFFALITVLLVNLRRILKHIFKKVFR